MTEPLFPAPAAGGGMPLDMALAPDTWRPTFSQFLGANVAEGFWATALGQGRAEARFEQAINRAEGEDARALPQEEWASSPFFRQGLPYRAEMTVAGARAMAEIFDENQARRALIAGRDAGFFGMAAGFGAGVLGTLPSPENYIPFAGPALEAARAGRLGVTLGRLAEREAAARVGGAGSRALAGAATGSIDGFLGTALTLPLINSGRQGFGDEITWADIVQDLALGAAAGGVLGGGLGAALGRRGAAPGNPAATPLADGAAPPSTARQDAALRALVAAAGETADTGDVNLALLPPELRAEVERLRADNLRMRAAQQPTAGEDAGLAARTAARPIGAATPATPGATGRATTPGGTEVQFAWEVVELDQLTTSHTTDFAENPAFPPELQPRDRSAPERQQQVREIATRLRPEEVEASPLTTTGAPIIGPDGVVESGNGRTMAIGLAYQQGLPTADAYRAFLVRAGFDGAAGMRQPVLVRRRTTEMDATARRRLTEESNTDVVDSLTPAEQARVDAGRLTPELLALMRQGELAGVNNADFVRGFLAGLSGRDQRALSADGVLTADGLARLRRALLARAWRDEDLVARLVNSTDEATQRMGNALTDAAPEVAQLRAAVETGQVRPELDAVDALVRALRRVDDARSKGRQLSTLFDQADMFDPPSPVERAFLSLLLRHPTRPEIGGVGRETIVERIGAYARRAMEAPGEPDMFGTPPPGIGDVLAATLRDARLEADPALRDLRADSYTPPRQVPPDPPSADMGIPMTPEPPTPAAAAAPDPVRAAAAQGLDADATAELAEVARLANAGRLPPEISAAIAEAQDLAARTENAAEAWQAATTCALGA